MAETSEDLLEEHEEQKKIAAPINPQQLTITLKNLKEIFGDNEDLIMFFLHWVRNGRNATQAYLELHPDVTYLSAKTLGARMLKKIDTQSLLISYGLDFNKYFTQLKEGLEATRIHGTDDNFIEIPDHKVRKDYHDKLGKLLDIEKTEGAKAEVNINNIIGNWVKGGDSA